MLDCMWATYTSYIRVCIDTDSKEIVVVGGKCNFRMTLPEAIYFLMRLAEKIKMGVDEVVNQ